MVSSAHVAHDREATLDSDTSSSSAPFTGRLARFGFALLLGALGFWLNRFNASLLSEGPEFIFGGAAALLAFVWLGEGLGLLATLLSLSTLWWAHGVAGIATLVYVLEAWAVYRLHRRIGSLVAASAIYWLTAGWVLDWLLYGRLLGLQFPFLMLLLVKQLLNGFLSAIVAEASLWLVPRRLAAALGRPRGCERLQFYVFRRVLFVVFLPLFGLTFLYAEVSYQRHVDEAHAELLRTAGNLRLRVDALALGQNEALLRLGRMVEMARASGGQPPSDLLAAFRQAHPEFRTIGLTDRAGMIVAALPDTPGERLAGNSVAGRRFFSNARRTMRMATVPQLVGLDGSRDGGRRPILVMAPALIDAQGDFDGIVFGVIDYQTIQTILEKVQGAARYVPTLITSDLRVVASLDPALPPLTSLRSRLPLAGRDPTRTALFTYVPPADGSWGSRLGMDKRYSAYQAIPAFDLAVLVDLPIVTLQAHMLPTAFSAIAGLLLTLALAYLVAVLVARPIARPLARASLISSDIAAGRFPGPAPLVALRQSPIEEVRDLGGNLLTMQDGLMGYRELSAARERESEERFRATFHQAAVGIAHLDVDLRWQRVNERLCDILGAAPEQLLGQPLAESLHPADLQATDRVFRAVLDGQPHQRSGEARYRRPDGGEAITQLTVSLVRDGNGGPKYFILVVEDIADRKQLEAELLQAQKMESVGRLAGGVAHDFNNLLTAILGYGELLAMRLAGNSGALDDLQQIQQAGERASRLTRQLLAFARRQVIEPRVVDLNELVGNMEAMLRRLIGEHIEFESRLERGLDRVRADPGQIEQVILNLAVNARDAMPDGGRLRLDTRLAVIDEGQRRASALPPGRYVVLTVADTGEGMSDEVRAHIFEPFFTTKDREQGTGLGLATCYGIVKQSGGEIEVTSEPGAGSSFRVYLPAVTGPDAAGSDRLTGTTRGGREAVLLVEDEPSVAGMARRALEQQGYEVLVAQDGEQALSLLADAPRHPDLLVTDVVMPRMGGVELAARLREASPVLKVLFTSGYSYDAIGQKGELARGTAFLQKPFTPAALARAVRQVLDREPLGS